MSRLVFLAYSALASVVLSFTLDATSAETTIATEAPSVEAEASTTTEAPTTTSTTVKGYEGEGGIEPTSYYLSTTSTVPLPEWTDTVPEVYGEGSGCTQEEASIIARALWDRGASDDSVKKMLRIISRESGCDSSAHNGNTRTRDDSWGLCQQNNLSGWFNEGKLLENYDRFAFGDDFAYNAESCAVMWAECGVGPWNYGNYYCSTPRELR